MLARLSMLLLTALLALSAIRAGSAVAAVPAAACASGCAVDADLGVVLPQMQAPAADTEPHDAALAVAPSVFPPALPIGRVLPVRVATPRRSYRRPALRPPSPA